MTKIESNGRSKLYIWVLSIIFVAGITYATIYVNAGKIADNVTDIKTVSGKVDTARNDVIGLQKDVFYIKEKVDTNAKVQQQILDEIKELRK